MNKNIIWIFLIFIVPIAAYFGIIKFSSPMCYECNELEKVVEEVFPKYKDKITLHKVDVTKRDNNVKKLIKEYNVTLVPTTVFKNQDGKITKRIEGTMKPEVFEEYMAELINE